MLKFCVCQILFLIPLLKLESFEVVTLNFFFRLLNLDPFFKHFYFISLKFIQCYNLCCLGGSGLYRTLQRLKEKKTNDLIVEN